MIKQMKKPMPKPPTKVVVTDPKQAVQMLKTYINESDEYVRVKGNRKKHATVMMMCNWYLKSYNQAVNPGWFGRTLNYVSNTSNKVTTAQVEVDGLVRTAYRLGA